MKLFAKSTLALMAAIITWGAAATEIAKPHLLPPLEERQWIQTLRQMKTNDGATVTEVLAYAQKMRPDEFKAGQMQIIYNGGSGNPDGVSIDIFIGQKRLPDDAMSLNYEVQKLGKKAASFKPLHPNNDWPEASLLIGRDAFLGAIDREYQEDCTDIDTQAKLC